MGESLIWISGASGGIGKALAQTVPWEGARVIGISRRPAEGVDHVEVDLSDPSTWPAVGSSFQKELSGFQGERVVFVHAAGTIQPIGFAGEVDTGDYATKVILNSAAPQVLGHLFLEAVRDVQASRHLIMLTSGAARSVYPGWSAYGAGKAAIDSWVQDVGTEQDLRGGAEQELGGGVQVLSVAPGTVDTGMQEQLRQTSEEHFPKRKTFVDLHEAGKLSDPIHVARDIWSLLERGLDNGSVVDLRDVADGGSG